MEEAFNTLGRTVDSIATKITTGKQAAALYKSKIMTELQKLMERIEQLKIDAANSPVPQLRQELQDSRQNLAAKTAELVASNSNLDELNSKISELTAQLQSKENEINAANRELENLTNLQNENAASQEDNNRQDAALAELQAQMQTLRTEKVELDQKLLASQQELGNFVQRIGEINTRLAGEIDKINTILDEFGDGSDVSDQIEAIGTNLQAIINVINNPVTTGGRRKTKKMRGGYLYSKKSNSSSISSYNSKSKSKSKSRSKKNKI